MATIAVDRPYLHGGQYAPRGLKHYMPHTGAGDIPQAGDVLVIGASSARLEVNNAPTGSLVALCEETRSALPSAGDLILCTLLLPGYLYEFNTNAGNLTTNAVVGLARDLAEHTSTGYPVIDDTGTTYNVVQIVGFVSNNSQFETNRFIGESDTSETAGATTRPDAQKGVPGDTSPRLLVTFAPGVLALLS